MARNVSGTYSLPLANVVPGTVVLASWANTTLNDVAPELTDSLSRSGKGGMTAALGIIAGTAAAPGLGFVLEPSTGLYRIGAGELGIAVGGVGRVGIGTAFDMVSGLAAGSAGTDFTFRSSVTRTAGLLLDVQNNFGVSRFKVGWNGIAGVSGAASGDATTDVLLNTVNTRAAGLLLDVQNNTVSRFKVAFNGLVATSGRAAADAGTDVILNTGNTRTAGLLLDVQNSGTSRFKVGWNGVTAVSGAAAGDATTDVLLNTTATRTNGLLLDVQNNTVSRFKVGWNGVTAVSGAAAGDATTDVVLNSTATRTAGLLLDVQNNTSSKFSVGPTGNTYAAATDDGAASLSWGTNWTDSGTNPSTLRRSCGLVTLSMHAVNSGGGNLTAVTTLPVGYRPTGYFTGIGRIWDNSITTGYVCMCSVNTAGQVTVLFFDHGALLDVAANFGAPAVNDAVDLSITFPAV